MFQLFFSYLNTKIATNLLNRLHYAGDKLMFLYKSHYIYFLIVSLFLFASCKHQRDTVSTKNDLLIYLDTLENKYEEACVQTGMANWNLYSGEAVHNLDAAKAKFAKIFLDSSDKKLIEVWRAKASSLADDTLARRLELWWRCFLGGSIYSDSAIAANENYLQKKITNFKFSYLGNRISLAEIGTRLRIEPNTKQRKNYWLITSQLSDNAQDELVELVKLRNEKAKQLGFYNYYSLSLFLQQIKEDWLLKTLNNLEEKTRANFQEFIESSRKKLKLKKFYPWDFDAAVYRWASISDSHFPKDSIFPILHRFHKNIGFKVDSLPIKETIKDIPFGGLNIGINIPHDSRYLLNPITGKRFYNLAFHEYGHALHTVHTQIRYPILKGYEWIPGASCGAYAEGVAELQAEFVNDPEWLRTYTSASQDDAEKYVATRTFGDLYYLRRTLKDFFFEYEMYKNPDQDLAALEREMYKKYLLVEIDSTMPHRYASSIWYVMYPCYYQNYILSKMIAAQVYEVIVNKFGSSRISNPELSGWIIEHLYANGEIQEWYERIRNTTGKSLETGAYLRTLKIMD